MSLEIAYSIGTLFSLSLKLISLPILCTSYDSILGTFITLAGSCFYKIFLEMEKVYFIPSGNVEIPYNYSNY